VPRAEPVPSRTLRKARFGLPLALFAIPAAAQEPFFLPPAAAPGTPPSLSAPGMPQAPDAPEVRLGQFFGFPYGGPTPGGDPLAPAWRLSASAGLSVRATDNASQSSRNREGDVITTVDAGLRAFGTSPLVSGGLFYTPSYSFSANGTTEDRFRHRFAGNLRGTIVPERVFLDLRGSANYLPITGGFLDGTTLTPGQDNTAQSASFSATPYIQQRFGSAATGLLGYTYTFSRTDGATRSLAPGEAPFFRGGRNWSDTAFAALRTGEDFGRIAAEARGSFTNYGGDGALDGSHRNLYILETRYALVRGFAVLLEGGYEDAEYRGTNPVEINEFVWGAGFRWDPDPDTTVTARYQRRFGFDAPSLDARVRLGPRTVFFARYSDRISSTALSQNDLLSEARVNEFGDLVDSGTGAPSVRQNEGLLAQQNGLFRVRRGDASVTQTFFRDSVTLRYSREERQPFSADPGTRQFEQNTDSVSLLWSRALDEATTLSLLGSVGLLSTPTVSSDTTTYRFRATLRHRLSETLFGSLAYEFTNRETSLNQGGSTLNPNDRVQNAVIGTLRKTF
jgi:uncharacterized protein (PEP-CTERM system associated)